MCISCFLRKITQGRKVGRNNGIWGGRTAWGRTVLGRIAGTFWGFDSKNILQKLETRQTVNVCLFFKVCLLLMTAWITVKVVKSNHLIMILLKSLISLTNGVYEKGFVFTPQKGAKNSWDAYKNQPLATFDTENQFTINYD